MRLFIIILLASALPLPLIAQKATPFVTEFNRDLQQSEMAGSEYQTVWWMPQEYWRVVGGHLKMLDREMVHVFHAALKGYVVVMVSSFRMDEAGNIVYAGKAEFTGNVRLIDVQKQSYSPVPGALLSDTMQVLTGKLADYMKAIIGAQGQHVHLFVFRPPAAVLASSFDTYRKGGFSLWVGRQVYRWDLPLPSLQTRRTCPKDAALFPGNYLYCPFHGLKLNANQAPPGMQTP